MSSARLTQLEEYYRQDPEDPFNIYALALEYLSADKQKSKELFKILLDRHEDYVATYYHAGKLWEELGDTAGALQIYNRGIECARRRNESKALRELKSAHDELSSD